MKRCKWETMKGEDIWVGSDGTSVFIDVDLDCCGGHSIVLSNDVAIEIVKELESKL